MVHISASRDKCHRLIVALLVYWGVPPALCGATQSPSVGVTSVGVTSISRQDSSVDATSIPRSRTPAPNTTPHADEMTYTSAVREPQGQTATLNEARFLKKAHEMTDEWHVFDQEATWEKLSIAECWNRSETEHIYQRPGLFYSPVFGFVTAELQTYTKTHFPAGKYWSSPMDLEQNCLCTRSRSWIKPDLSYRNLNNTVTYWRAAGSHQVYRWRWGDATARDVWKRNPDNRFSSIMTHYKMMAINFLETYAKVTVACRQQDVDHWRISKERGIFNNSFVQYTYAWRARNLSLLRTRVACVFTGEIVAVEPVQTHFVVQEVDWLHNRYGTRAPANSVIGSTWHRHQRMLSKNIPTIRAFRSNIYAYKTFAQSPLSPSVNVWQEKGHRERNKNTTMYRLSRTAVIPNWASRIRWVKPLVAEVHPGFDGPPVRVYEDFPLYRQHPMYLRTDRKCHQRVGGNRQCLTPVGGIATKMAFWDRVEYDPAENEERFPAPPIRLEGSIKPDMKITRGFMGTADIADDAVDVGQPREKRQLWELAVMVFGYVSLDSKINNLADEFNDKIAALTTSMNERFARDEVRLKQLALKINEQAYMTRANDQRITQLLIDSFKRESVREERLDQLQNEVDENKRMIFATLDMLLQTVQTTHTMSLSEMALDKLMMLELQNLTGKPLFDTSKAYLVRLADGALHLSEYAQEISVYKENQLRKTRRLAEEATRRRRELANMTALGEKDLDDWCEEFNDTKVMSINVTQWKEKNITAPTIQLNSTDLAGNLMKGLGVVGDVVKTVVKETGGVLKEGVGAVGDVVGSGLGALLKPLTSILIPVGIGIVVVILLCCLVQLHPDCSRAKETLPSIMQLPPYGVEKQVEKTTKQGLINKALGAGAAGAVELATL